MRITQTMLNSQVLRNLQSVFKRISKSENQLASGQKIQYPSDDAVLATRASNIASQKREIEQYKRNVETTSNIANSYDATIQEVSSIYQRIRELMVRGASDTLSSVDREAIAKELEKIKEHLVSIANTRIGTTYIFGGPVSDKPPVSVDSSGKVNIELTPEEADRKLKVQVAGYNVEYNVTVRDLFVTRRGESVFDVVDRMIKDLRNGNSIKLSNTDVGAIDDLVQNTNINLAFVGSVTRMLEMIDNRLEDLNSFITEYLSKETDADITEVVAQLSMDQAVLQAALKSSAKVITPTLVDFLS
jgi:flagellar hook-associated protein 3 FlgL